MKILFLFTVNKSFLSDYFVSLATHVAALGNETIVFSLKQQRSHHKVNEVTYITEQKKSTLHLYRVIYRLIKEERPTIVISNFSYVNPALFAGKLLNVEKNIAWQHTLIEQTKATKRQIFIKSKFLNWADGIVVNSKRLKDELENQFRVRGKQIDILPFWSSIASYTPKKITLPSAEILIGCCGRLEIDKNQRTLLKAFAEVKQAMPTTNLKLLLAGEGSDKRHLENLAETLAIKDEVIFLGLLSAEEMAYFYTKVDLLVLPSLHEAFGLTFIEALALNTPLLVSEAFGALSFIEPNLLMKYDMVFTPDDVKMLVQKMKLRIAAGRQENHNYKALYDSCFSDEIIRNKFEEIIALHTT
ncbi:glycosyltransferase family 4 protein [Rasiella rasia]|uniref:Glycosyltransferase family 4 protein n=1 Tax=Rasiella rasia TaxID=2744027 RepID=A0A6G6GQ85_9FLAO|nr:glycosyltransferase family 4 protein [Rasiella rasia]QIE60634.1 glycosyltransferase family 4 protein [Rasiella rasia]